jgi:ABC-type iron transport system FetAB permease component
MKNRTIWIPRIGDKMIKKRMFRVSAPSGVRLMISMLLLIAILFGNIVRGHEEKDIFYYIWIVWLILCSAILVIIVYRTYVMKPGVMEMDQDVIVINGTEINAEAVACLLINDNKKRVIGIKPKGRNIVPLKLCFTFTEEQTEAIRQLESWAQEHHVKISKRFFMRWM